MSQTPRDLNGESNSVKNLEGRRLMKKLVHTRDVSIQTFALGSHAILVEGRLVDHRHPPRRVKSSEESELVHDMVIQLKVKGPQMAIEQAGAKMPHHPRKQCPEVLPCIRNLEGLEIAPGYTMKVKKLIGGVRGCAHLTSLAIAMGESAVQGYWAAYGRKRKMKIRKQTIKKFLNTCHLWREDGPIIQEIRDHLKSSSE